MVDQDSEEYRKWKHGSNEAEANLKQLNCPRGCGNLTGTLQENRRSEVWTIKIVCDTCEGIFVNPQQFIKGEKQLKRFIEEKIPGETKTNLKCPNCSEEMLEITLEYDKIYSGSTGLGSKIAKAPLEVFKGGGMSGEDVVPVVIVAAAVAAIGLTVGVTEAALRVPSNIAKRKKNQKEMERHGQELTIDMCKPCNSFWFDKNEIERFYDAQYKVKRNI
jgi:hypothetical protein